MAVGEKGPFHIEFKALFIHLQQEFFIEVLSIIKLTVDFYLFCFFLVGLDELSTEDRQGDTCIVAARQHHSIQQLLDSVDLSDLQLRNGPFNLRLKSPDANF